MSVHTTESQTRIAVLTARIHIVKCCVEIIKDLTYSKDTKNTEKSVRKRQVMLTDCILIRQMERAGEEKRLLFCYMSDPSLKGCKIQRHEQHRDRKYRRTNAKKKGRKRQRKEHKRVRERKKII